MLTETNLSRSLAGLAGAPARSGRARFWLSLALAGVLLYLWFGCLEFRGLIKPDEGRYAEIPLEMLRSGDWVTPRVNGLKYFEKPPLQYWATASIYALAGPDEWTARLWPALTGFFGVLLLALACVRSAGGKDWRSAVLVAAGCWGYFLGSQILTLDMGLSFFLSAALVCFICAQPAPGQPPRRAWMLAVWAAMAGAVLTKGLIGIVLPALALAAYLAVERDFGLLRRLHWREGAALFLLIVLPWFVLVQLRNPEFFRFFFIHEHFERYAQSGHHRLAPWWFFLALLPLALMPWISLLPAALRHAWRAPRQGSLASGRLLVLWALAILVFFSASHSKLPAYILPALPALLLLIAAYLPHARPAELWGPPLTCLAAAVLLWAGFPLLEQSGRLANVARFATAYRPWMYAGGAILAGGAVLALICHQAGRRQAYVAVLALANLIALQLLLSGTHEFDDYFSAEPLVDKLIENHAAPGPEVPVYSVGNFDQSLAFYLRHPTIMVVDKSELVEGIAADPARYVPTLARFEALWRASGDAYAVMTRDQYAAFVAAGLPMQRLVQDEYRVIVRR